MATVSKNFRIKDGLIVEGTTGTINGNNILTDASTTSSLAEGTRLYYTNERVDDRVANLVNGGTGITVTYDDEGNALGLSADFGEFSTTEIVEGDKLFFTDERAQDAIAAALAAGNHVNITVEYNDAGNAINLTGAITYTDADARNAISGGDSIGYNSTTGVISAEATTLGGISVTESGLEVNRTVVDTWYDAAGSADTVQGNLETHASNTTTHGVTGNIVGTSDQQVLTNKTINDELYFTNPSTVANDGGIKVNDVSEDLEITAYTANLHLKGQNDVTVTANNGNIVLVPDAVTELGKAYINSVSAGNQIATNSYVDNAVAGLAWKESVNLIAASNMDITADFAGLVIDGHEAFNGFDHNHYRILFKGQTTSAENGIYYLQWDGAAPNANMFAIRATDADSYNELIGAAVFVMEGTQYGQTSWVQSNHYLISFADQSWTQFSGTGSVTAGTGISVNGLEVSVDRTTVDTWYDEAGAASAAEQNAKDYGDANFVNLADLPGQLDDYVPLTQKGANSGVATLDAGGDVPASQLGNINTAITDLGSAITPSGVVFSAGGYIAQSGGSYANLLSHSNTNVTEITGTTQTDVGLLYNFASKLVFGVKHGTDVQATEVLVVMDSSHNIYMTEYASICSAVSDLVTITVEYAGYSNVQYVKVTPTNSGTTTVTWTQISIA